MRGASDVRLKRGIKANVGIHNQCHLAADRTWQSTAVMRKRGTRGDESPNHLAALLATDLCLRIRGGTVEVYVSMRRDCERALPVTCRRSAASSLQMGAVAQLSRPA